LTITDFPIEAELRGASGSGMRPGKVDIGIASFGNSAEAGGGAGAGFGGNGASSSLRRFHTMEDLLPDYATRAGIESERYGQRIYMV
jgi:hypothetical protein